MFVGFNNNENDTNHDEGFIEFNPYPLKVVM